MTSGGSKAQQKRTKKGPKQSIRAMTGAKGSSNIAGSGKHRRHVAWGTKLQKLLRLPTCLALQPLILLALLLAGPFRNSLSPLKGRTPLKPPSEVAVSSSANSASLSPTADPQRTLAPNGLTQPGHPFLSPFGSASALAGAGPSPMRGRRAQLLPSATVSDLDGTAGTGPASASGQSLVGSGPSESSHLGFGSLLARLRQAPDMEKLIPAFYKAPGGSVVPGALAVQEPSALADSSRTLQPAKEGHTATKAPELDDPAGGSASLHKETTEAGSENDESLVIRGHNFTRYDVGYAHFSSYRMTPSDFTSCGLATGSAHKVAQRGELSCIWTQSSTGEHFNGTLTFEITGFKRMHQYTTMCLFCSLGVPKAHPVRTSAGAGSLTLTFGADIIPAYVQPEDVRLQDFRFPGPLKYDLVFCPSPIHDPLVPASITEWLQYHLALGVDYVFLYDRGALDTELMLALKPFVIAKVLSILDFHDQEKYKAWYFGQDLAMNDCMMRFRETAHWVAFGDLDEYLALSAEPTATVKQYLRAYEEKGVVWIGRGGYWYKNYCNGTLWGPQVDKFAVEMILFHEVQPKCFFSKAHNPDVCPSVVGRRKDMVNPRRVGMVMVHQVLRAAAPQWYRDVPKKWGMQERVSHGLHFHHYRGLTNKGGFCHNAGAQDFTGYVKDDTVAQLARRARECCNRPPGGIPTTECFYSQQ